MWQLYVKYALPIFIISIIFISIFREIKKQTTEEVSRKELLKKYIIAITITFLLIIIITMVILK